MPLIPEETELLGGLELGGVPIATLLAQASGLRVVFVRKAAKDYGTCRVSEGEDVAGRRVLIVEDVVTSGGQIVKSAEDLRRLGAIVDDAICVIDREAGGPESLRARGLKLTALFTISELAARALAKS